MSLSQTGTFVETIIDLVDGVSRANVMGFSSNNKLVLNGKAGPGGGSGIPWGGLVGCLIQRRVCFDTTEAATPCILPSSSLLDNLNRIRWHHKPATWFEMSPTDPRSMRVHVASGLWYKDEADEVDFTGGNSPIITSPVANPRIDVVYLTPSGIVAVSKGTESASPTYTIPSGIILPIGAVYVTPVACGIGWPCDTDLYSGSLYSGSIYKDLRPFVTYPGGGGGDSYWSDEGTYLYPTDARSIKLEDTRWIGNSATSARLHFDSSGAINYAYFKDCYVGINTATPSAYLQVEDITLDTITTTYGMRATLIKIAGLTDAADHIYGHYSHVEMNQPGGVIGHLFGIGGQARVTAGTVGLNAIGLQYTVALLGGITTNDVIGINIGVDGNAGSVGGDVRGININIDLEAAMTSIAGNVYGASITVDADEDPGVLVYMLHLSEGTNIDFGIYQSGSATNRFGGDIEPVNAAGQNLGSVGRLWDVFASYVDLPDGGWIGNAVGDMRIIFHAADRIEIATDGLNIYTIDEDPSGATPMTATAANIKITGGDNATGDDAGIWLRNEETNVDWSIYVDESDFDHLKIARENTDILEIGTTGNITLFSGNDLDPEDATGQDLGGSAHRWDLYANDINMDNGGVIHCTTLGGPIITFDSISDYLEITECRISIGHTTPIVALDINTPTWNHNGVLLGSGGPPANLGMIKFTGIDFYGFTPSGWLSLTASGTGGGGGVSLWTDYGAYIEPTNPRDVRISTTKEIYPEDATGQDLGRAGNRWDIFARRIDLSDAGWIGNSSTTARLVFDSSGGTDYAYFMSCYVGIKTATPTTAMSFGEAGATISFIGTAGGGNEGIQYLDAGSGLRYGLLFPGGDAVVLCNRALNGTVEIRANAAAGAGGEVTVATFEDDQITFLASGGDVGIGSAPVATYRLTVYEATDNCLVRIETDKVNGGAHAHFINDAQEWRIGVISSDIFVIRDVTGTTNPVNIEPGADTNSIYIDADGHVGVGADPSGNQHFYIVDTTVDTTSTYYGIHCQHTRTGGATDHADNMTGVYIQTTYNNTGVDLGAFRGIHNVLTLTDGDIGNINLRHIQGFNNQCFLNGGTVTGALYTVYNYALVDGATVDGAAYGLFTYLNLDLGTVSGSAYGIYSWVDDDLGVTGNVINLYLDNDTGVDYAIYSDGTAPYYLAGSVGIGVAGPDSKVEILATTTQLRLTHTNATDYATFAVDGDGQLDITTVDGGGAGGHICLLPDGNVGIAEAAPQRLLHVDGRVRIDDGTTAPGTTYTEMGTDWYGDGSPIGCGNPHGWLRIDIEGVTYKIPCFQ